MAELISPSLGMLKWHDIGYFFFQTSTLPPSMHRKLTGHRRCCGQSNQVFTTSHVDWEENSNMIHHKSLISHWCNLNLLFLYFIGARNWQLDGELYQCWINHEVNVELALKRIWRKACTTTDVKLKEGHLHFETSVFFWTSLCRPAHTVKLKWPVGMGNKWAPLHTRDWEPMTITLQALSLVEKTEPVQVCFTLRLRDQRSMWMQDGCKVYMDSYMASNGSCFMVTWTISKNHLLEVGLTWSRETMEPRMLTYVDSL